MLPLDPQGLGEATTGPRPLAGIVATAFALAGCVAAGAAGVAVGSVVQAHSEARPDAIQVRKLDALNEPERSSAPVDRDRGPNRADLGGGR